MKKFIAGVMIAVSMVLTITAPTYAAVEVKGEVLRNTIEYKSAVVYSSGYMSGSGGFLKGGYVLTNHHVIDGRENFTIKDYDGNVYKAEVIAGDQQKDLALLKTEAVDHNYFTVGTMEQAGDKRAVSSVPTEYSFKIKEGTIKEWDALMTMTTTDSQGNAKVTSTRTRNIYTFLSEPGNSGSPVVNSRDELVGVIHGSANSDKSAVGITYRDVKEFLDTHMK